MLPGEHLSVEAREKLSTTEGSGFLKSDEEILSACDYVSRGNTSPTDLISTQPLPAVVCPAEASQQAVMLKSPQHDFLKPTCPQCGLTVPDQSLHPVSPSLSRLQDSNSSVHSGGSSKRSKSKGSLTGSHHTTATPADSCFQLLMACLWCQCSLLLLGLLEACSSCFQGLCPSCCRSCAHCCSAVQDAPVEELNCHAHCHSVLFESCCEPTECLEFCLECCEICHRS